MMLTTNPPAPVAFLPRGFLAGALPMRVRIEADVRSLVPEVFQLWCAPEGYEAECVGPREDASGWLETDESGVRVVFARETERRIEVLRSIDPRVDIEQIRRDVFNALYDAALCFTSAQIEPDARVRAALLAAAREGVGRA